MNINEKKLDKKCRDGRFGLSVFSDALVNASNAKGGAASGVPLTGSC